VSPSPRRKWAPTGGAEAPRAFLTKSHTLTRDRREERTRGLRKPYDPPGMGRAPVKHEYKGKRLTGPVPKKTTNRNRSTGLFDSQAQRYPEDADVM
jgi:hypothetical protein